MSLKTKLTLLSTLWLILILLAFNVFIYLFMLRLTTRNEIQLLYKKADTILQDDTLMKTNNLRNPNLLMEYASQNEMLRLVSMNGKVLNQLDNTNNILGKFHPMVRSRVRSEVRNDGQNRLIFVQVPMYRGSKQIAVLEIGRVMHLMDDFMGILVTALTFTTLGAVVLALFGGYFYTRFLFLPLRRLSQTMRNIQESGRFRKLRFSADSPKDEFVQLGQVFNDMIDRLEINFRNQRRFVEDASHELRTPLTIIESYASLLKRWGGEDPELRMEAVTAIQDEAVRLKGLATNLLKLHQVEEQNRQPESSIHLQPIIESTAQQVGTSMKRKIEVKLPQEPLWICGEEEQFKQLFIILLDNAIKYSSDKITVTGAHSTSEIILKVKDRGEGIPSQALPHIFERFYRVDRSRSRKSGGFGLGLSIAKKIVELHKGEIRMESAPQQGTTVVMSFPLIDRSRLF